MLVFGIADLLQRHAPIPDNSLWLSVGDSVNAKHDAVNVVCLVDLGYWVVVIGFLVVFMWNGEVAAAA